MGNASRVRAVAPNGMPLASNRQVPGTCRPYTIWSLQPWYAPPTLTTHFLPVYARAPRIAAITLSVPDPSMRNCSQAGIRRLTNCASLSSYSWKRPVTGPDCSTTSATFSRSGA